MVVDPDRAEPQLARDAQRAADVARPHRGRRGRSRRRWPTRAPASSSANRCTVTTGPNTSRWTISASCATPAITVGSTKQPRSPAPVPPPVSTVGAAGRRRARRSRATRALLLGRDDRAHLDVLVGRVADLRASPPSRRAASSSASYTAGAGEHPARGRAVLARVVEAGLLHARGHRLDVGVVEHHHRRLAAELEVHALQRVRRGPRDLLAGRDVAGQRHHGDARVARRCAAPTGSPSPVIDVEHAGREDVGGAARRAASASAASCSDGLSTTVLPAASAGPSFQARHHRAGSSTARSSRRRRAARGRTRRVAAQVLAGRAALEAARGAGEEAQVVGAKPRPPRAPARAACRRSGTRAAPAARPRRRARSAISNRTAARSAGVRPRHSGSAACAARTARSTSASSPRGTVPIASPVAGLRTSITPPATASTHSPPTRFI